MKQLAVDIIKAIVQATILKPLINTFSNGFAGALTPMFGTSLSKDGGGLLGGLTGQGGAASITAAGTSFAATVQGAATSFAATLTGGSASAGATLTSGGATAGASLTAAGATAGTEIATGGATTGITLTTAGATTGSELISAGAVTAGEIEAAGAAAGASSAASSAGGLFSLFGFANGGAFDGGQIKAFAQGDVFDRPTGFQYGGGKMGVLGEAGPEAIMPLRRGPGGGLGIVAHGAGGGSNILPLVRGTDGKMAVKMFADGGTFNGGGEASLGNGANYSEASLSTVSSTNAKGAGTVVNFAPVIHVAGDMTDATAQRLHENMREIARETFKDGITKSAPQIVNQSVNAVQSKNRNDRQYLARR